MIYTYLYFTLNFVNLIGIVSQYAIFLTAFEIFYEYDETKHQTRDICLRWLFLVLFLIRCMVYSIKSINKSCFNDANQKKKVMQEVNLLKVLKHKNIVRLFENFENEKYLLYVIELCAGGDLLSFVRRRKRLDEREAKYLFKQVALGLAYCHRNLVLHRDIKLENLLLDEEGIVKICDFGVS